MVGSFLWRLSVSVKTVVFFLREMHQTSAFFDTHGPEGRAGQGNLGRAGEGKGRRGKGVGKEREEGERGGGEGMGEDERGDPHI